MDQFWYKINRWRYFWINWGSGVCDNGENGEKKARDIGGVVEGKGKGSDVIIF